MIKKISKKQREKNKEKTIITQKMHSLFLEIWDEREDLEGACYCFETGRRLDGRIYRSNTCCYDHVLEKSKYPQYALDPKNIIILHPDVHQQKGLDIDKVPKVREYREKLLSLHYEKGKL